MDHLLPFEPLPTETLLSLVGWFGALWASSTDWKEQKLRKGLGL